MQKLFLIGNVSGYLIASFIYGGLLPAFSIPAIVGVLVGGVFAVCVPVFIGAFVDEKGTPSGDNIEKVVGKEDGYIEPTGGRGTESMSINKGPSNNATQAYKIRGRPIVEKIVNPDGFETKQCPKCAETIKLRALVCRFCRHTFDEAEVSEEISRLEVEAREVEDIKQKAILFEQSELANKAREAEERKQKAIHEEEIRHANFELVEKNKKQLLKNSTLSILFGIIGTILISLGILVALFAVMVGRGISPLIILCGVLVLPGSFFLWACSKRNKESARLNREIEELSGSKVVQNDNEKDLLILSKELLAVKGYQIEQRGLAWAVIDHNGLVDFFESLESLYTYAKSRK